VTGQRRRAPLLEITRADSFRYRGIISESRARSFRYEEAPSSRFRGSHQSETAASRSQSVCSL
jgi:hypothetical protein